MRVILRKLNTIHTQRETVYSIVSTYYVVPFLQVMSLYTLLLIMNLVNVEIEVYKLFIITLIKSDKSNKASNERSFRYIPTKLSVTK